ncbi:MAG: DUF2189 domain-containing protein [Pseudomonadota bacterium]
MAKPVKTIGNPATWFLNWLRGSAHFVQGSAQEVAGQDIPRPQVATIGLDDIRAALRMGFEDLGTFRTDVLFIVILYPVLGLGLMAFAFQLNLLPLLFPLMSGFALLGPIAAICLYEMSRLRETGQEARLLTALRVVASPAIGAILAIGLLLVALFLAWMVAAYVIFALTLGPEPPVSATAFLSDSLTTPAGWAMIVIGCGVGFVFAAVTLALTIVSLPLVIHRHAGVLVALATSLKVTRKNPMTVAVWGALVVCFLVLGMLPLLVGLMIAFPVLGHATWHLYRRAVI